MTVNNGQQVTRTAQDFVPFEVPKDFKLPDNGLGGPNGGQTTTVSAADLSDALKEQDIYGPRTVNPLDSSAPDGSSDKGTTPANPNAPYILTAEPEAKSSAIGDYFAPKPEFNFPNGGPEGVSLLPFAAYVAAVAFGAAIGVIISAVQKDTHGTVGAIDNAMKGKYLDPDADTGGGGHSLPDIDGMLSGGKSLPNGDAMGLGQFKAGSGYDFKAIESKLETLLGFDAGGKSSGGQSGSTGGGSVAPPTGLEALMQKFSMDGFSAHLKDGSFDLDNFSAGAPSAKGPILDLDGNGKQDVIEWALSQIVAEKAEIEIVEAYHSNPALAEFHQFMMSKYADVFIA